MASLLQTSVVQPFLMLLNNSIETSGLETQNITTFNATQNATGGYTALKMPTDFSSLITFIYSFSALRDYLKLIVLGGALETLRRLSSASYTSLVDRWFITATFESEDLSYGGHSFFFATGRTIDPGDQNG
jgi:chaperone BCS1